MVEQNDWGDFEVRLPNNFNGFYLKILEKALNDLGYKCATIEHLNETLGDKRRIPLGQYHLTLEEIEHRRRRDWELPGYVNLREATIRFYERNAPEQHLIYVEPLRGETEKAKKIALQIEKEIKHRSDLFRQYLKLGGGHNTPEKQKLLVQIGFYEPKFFENPEENAYNFFK